MSSAPSKKHLSFDIWTSPNSIAFLAVLVHFADQSGTVHHQLLEMPRIKGRHSGENQAPLITKIAADFGISAQVGYFQSDNVDSNTKAVEFVLQNVSVDLSIDARKKLISRRRIRCLGHILNLAAKAFIEGNCEDITHSLSDEIDGELSVEDEEGMLLEWRKRGPIGKLHNIVHFIRRSPQRRENFLAIAKGDATDGEIEDFGRVVFDRELHDLMLQSDNSTRWNSVFIMIERTIRLKPCVEIYCERSVRDRDPARRLPTEDLLDADDWATLASVKALLEPFKRVTKRFEGEKPYFSEVIGTVIWLISYLRSQLYILHPNLGENTQFTGGAVYMQPEITVSPEDPAPEPAHAYEHEDRDEGYASQLQRPRRQTRVPQRFNNSQVELLGDRRIQPPHFELETDENGDPDPELAPDDYGRAGISCIRISLENSIQKLEKYVCLMEQSPAYWSAMILHPGLKRKWIDYFLTPAHARRAFASFKELYDEEYAHIDVPAAQPPSESHRRPLLVPPTFYDAPEDPENKDEIAEYLEEPFLPVDDVQAWWITNKGRLPRLSRMAFDLISIPAMSSGCERVFSLAKLVVGPQRQSMKEETINMLMCIKNWQRMSTS
jgi:hypothetical protein